MPLITTHSLIKVAVSQCAGAAQWDLYAGLIKRLHAYYNKVNKYETVFPSLIEAGEFEKAGEITLTRSYEILEEEGGDITGSDDFIRQFQFLSEQIEQFPQILNSFQLNADVLALSVTLNNKKMASDLFKYMSDNHSSNTLISCYRFYYKTIQTPAEIKSLRSDVDQCLKTDLKDTVFTDYIFHLISVKGSSLASSEYKSMSESFENLPDLSSYLLQH